MCPLISRKFHGLQMSSPMHHEHDSQRYIAYLAKEACFLAELFYFPMAWP